MLSSALKKSLLETNDFFYLDKEVARLSQINEIYTELGREAIFLSKKIFKSSPSDNLINNYVSAHLKLPKNLLLGAEILNKIIRLNLDPVAIEFSRRKNFYFLGLKLKLLYYLAENTKSYDDLFINKKISRVDAF